MRSTWTVIACLVCGFWGRPILAVETPPGFVVEPVLATLEDPDYLKFSPDGRLFVCERIQGRLRVADYDSNSDAWILDPEPFAVFEVPHDGSGVPERHRSSGIRDIAFDPAFGSNGYVYVSYMRHAPRHNRVVRVTQSLTQPNRAQAGSEMLLLDLPFNSGDSSGSHNGGALEFGPDGKLYITTGDGWNGGDPVTSLSTFTGKIFRINPDGTIPADNPFFTVATGDYRAIHSLGLRNPFSLSRHPTTGELFVQDVQGSDKADVFVVAPGVDYGHDGGSGLGPLVSPWTNGGAAGSRVISGGAWVPTSSNWPLAYHGGLIVSLWNGGRFSRVISRDDPTVVSFASALSIGDRAPTSPQFGPDGSLYWVRTTYETGAGEVLRVRYGSPVDPPLGSLRAHFTFDDIESPTLDSVGGLTGFLSGDGTVSATAGYVDRGLQFDGADGRFEVEGIDLSGGSGFAVSMWFRAESFGQPDGRLAAQATGVAEQDHFWMLSTIDETALRFRLRTGGVTSTLATPTGLIEAERWYSLIANYDGTQMQILLDGVVVASTVKSGSLDQSSTVPTAFGNQPTGAGPRAFHGFIDEVELFSRPLAGEEIVARATLRPSSGMNQDPFVRGDANGDQSINITDAITVLSTLFGTLADPLCPDAIDVDDSGSLDLADAVSLLQHLFDGPSVIPGPWPECGPDVTPPSLPCNSACP